MKKLINLWWIQCIRLLLCRKKIKYRSKIDLIILSLSKMHIMISEKLRKLYLFHLKKTRIETSEREPWKRFTKIK